MPEHPGWPSHLELAREPGNWLAKSNRFRLAAKILNRSYEAARIHCASASMNEDPVEAVAEGMESTLPCAVCLGYAVELGIKSLIVQDDPACIPDKGQITIRSHDLVALARRASLNVEEDTEVLRRLQDFIEWGKYPTMTKPSEYTDPLDDTRPYHPHVKLRLEEFYPRVEGMLKKINEVFAERASNGPTNTVS